jgi:hypothetical protein
MRDRAILGHWAPQSGKNLMQTIDLPGGTVSWTII